MIKVETKIETFWYKDEFFVDVVTLPEEYEAWIYSKNYGVKSLMFGAPKYQQSYTDFLRIVENNIPEYIEIYDDEYMDE